MNRNDLFEALELSGEDQYEGLRRRLRAMERDGQLVFTRRQCYALPEKLEMVKGYVIGHKDGHGWVRPEGSTNKDNDILLPHHQMRTIIHGDLVLVQPTGTDKRGRKRGVWSACWKSVRRKLSAVSSLNTVTLTSCRMIRVFIRIF